ncbi:hypothetical protein niasHS_006831 [Heterodera schachtii]|uniref:C2H2-type domain-containing protein n=1 Tax=Heterodera schachtii TaxID=97005 RepID=A0ABD2JIC5_HETSC
MGQLADQTEGKPCSSAVFRLRRPIERLRHLFTKRPMLLQLLNTAFKLFVKRAFRVRPSVVPNARVPPRRSPRPLGRPASIESTAMAKRRVALRLRRRYFRFVPLPRLPPFQCPKCALLTRRPQTMLNHICAKKPAEFKNVNQTVELGFRSRVRDAMSVMERIPNPQAMQFRTCSEPLRDSDHFSLQQPLKLSDIVLKHLQRLNVVQIVQTQKVPFCQFVPFHSLSRTTEKEQSTRTTPQNQRDAFALTSTGFFCSICARLFPRYADWDAHLPDEEGTAGSCPSDGRHPMPIECPSGEMIPRDGLPINCASSSLLVDESDKSIGQQQSHWRCSACALQQFATRAEFHAHLLKCALANTIF